MKIICVMLGIIIGLGQLSVSAVGAVALESSGTREMSMDDFIRRAIARDTAFEEILIDELTLQYQKDLQLPARDFVISLRSQYQAYLSSDREDPQNVLELSKLFPSIGTEVSAEYSARPSFSSGTISSGWSLAVSQPIARNAFGQTTRWRDRMIGLETTVARHQIVEAYEDYLAGLMVAYNSWYEAWENLKVGESSYQENLKLLDNIRARQTASIALPIDVNKITLQVLARKESLVDLRSDYEEALNVIEQSIRPELGEKWVPVEPAMARDMKINFDADYQRFESESRTYKILRLLSEQSELDVEISAGELLPSINLLFGYEVQGEDYEVKSKNDLLFGGIELEWPFPDQVNQASYQVAQLNSRKTHSGVVTRHFRLLMELRNLVSQIGRAQERAAIADEKIGLAKAVLEDESGNYTYGKVSLNDYIQAVNQLDNNRFTKIRQDAQHRTLWIEWLRRTDQLVDIKTIRENHSSVFSNLSGKEAGTDGKTQ